MSKASAATKAQARANAAGVAASGMLALATPAMAPPPPFAGGAGIVASGTLAVPIGTSPALHDPFTQDVMCNSCGNFAHFTRCRSISKSKGTWQCNACGVKATQLRRHLNSWPTPEFLGLSEDLLYLSRVFSSVDFAIRFLCTLVIGLFAETFVYKV